MKCLLIKYRILMAMMFSIAFLSQVDAVGQCDPCPSSTAVQIGSTATAGTNSYSIGQYSLAQASSSYSFGCKVSTDSVAEGNIVIGTGGVSNFVNTIDFSIMLGTRLYGSVPTLFLEDALASTEDFGNVGIGTVNPVSRLHVFDEIRVGETSGADGILIFNNDAGNLISFTTPSSMSNQDYVLPTAEGVDGDVLIYTTGGQLTWGSGGTATDDWRLAGNNNATASSKLGTLNTQPLRLFTDGAERMRVTASGLIGIGTTNPTGKVHVKTTANTKLILERGSASTESRLVFNDESGTESAQILYDDDEDLVVRNMDQDEDIIFITNEGGTSTEVMRIDGSTSRVGIGGIVNPSVKLHVKEQVVGQEIISQFTVGDAPLDWLQIRNNSATAGEFVPEVFGNANNHSSEGLRLTAETAIDTGSIPVMVFTSRQVGTPDPVPVTTRPLFEWRNNGPAVMHMDANGNLGIGTTGPLDLLHVNGGACKPSTNTWTICSDENLKTDISEFTDGLDVLREINPVWFRYNGIGGLPIEPLTPGVIAQQVLNVAPYMIDSTQMLIDTTTNATMPVLTYNANALFYLLLNSVKELDERTESINNLHDEMEILNDAFIQLQNEYNQLNQSIYDCCSSGGASFKFEDEDESSEVPRNTRGSITVVPNPFSSNTNVSFELDGAFTSGQLLIIDSSGKIVYQIPVLETRSSISITSEDLAVGTYYCSLYADGKQVGSTRIVKIR